MSVIETATNTVTATIGGTMLAITGTNLSGTTAISFGAAGDATSFPCTATACTAIDPGWGSGTVDVQITTPGGIRLADLSDRHWVRFTPPSERLRRGS